MDDVIDDLIERIAVAIDRGDEHPERCPYPDDYRRMAKAVVAELGLEPQLKRSSPIMVPVFDAGGEPMMRECGHQEEFVSAYTTMRRWVGAWEEVGPRVSREEMAARYAARTAEIAAKYRRA